MSPEPVPQIPESTAPFFQDVTFSRLDVAEHADLVCERILAYGNRAEVRWLLKTYGQQRVQDWIRMAGQKRLPRRRYNLWCHLFNLPAQETQPSQIWPY
jgi:hypothetical protein